MTEKPFFLSWIVGFTLAQKYALLFADRPPEFLILGMHPSFFWIVLLYWLAGLVILGAGLKKLSGRWMSSEDWNAFKEKIETLKKESGPE